MLRRVVEMKGATRVCVHIELCEPEVNGVCLCIDSKLQVQEFDISFGKVYQYRCIACNGQFLAAVRRLYPSSLLPVPQ